MLQHANQRPPRRWLKRVLFVASVLALAPVAAAAITLYTEWGRDRVTEAAVQAIRSELGLIARFDSVHVDLFPLPTVSAHGIKLDHPDHGRFAEARALSIRPSLRALIAGRVDLRTIALDEPSVHLVIRDGVVINLPEIDTGATDSAPEHLPFSRLVVRDATLAIDAEPVASGELVGVDLTLDVVDGVALDFILENARGTVVHPLGEETLQALEAQGFFDPDDGVSIERFKFESPHLGIHGREGFVPIPFDDRYRGKVELRVDLDHLDNLPHGIELPPLFGELEAEGILVGTTRGPTGSAKIRIRKGEIDVQRRGIGDVDLELEADPDEIRILSGTMQIIEDGGTAAIAGRIGLGEGFPVDLDVDIQNFQFARFLRQMNVSQNAIVQWHLTGPAHVRGTLEPFRLRGPIELESSFFLVTKGPFHDPAQERVIGAPRASIRGRMDIDTEAFRFLDLRATAGRTRFTSDVHLRFDDRILVVAQGDIDARDASPLLEFPIGGHGPFQVRVEGPYGNPDVRGHLHLEEFSFNTFTLGTVESDWHLEEGGLAARFPSIAATKRDSRYRVDNFFLDFTDDRLAITGDLVTPHFRLQDFYDVFHYEEDERFTPYQGVVTGRALLRYTNGFPGDSPAGTFVADMDFGIESASIDDYQFRDGHFEGQWDWRNHREGYRGGVLTIHHADLKKGNGTVTVQGRMRRGGELAMTVAADRIALRDTEGLGDRFPKLSGVFSAVADIGGRADSPRANVDVAITGVSYERSMLGDGRLFVRLTDRDDPWVAAAESWDPAAPPTEEPCAAARAGFFHGRWPDDPPIRTLEGLQPAHSRPTAYLVCGEGLGGRLKVDMALGRTRDVPLRGSVSLHQFDLSPFLPTAFGNLHGETTAQLLLDGGAFKRPGKLGGHLQIDRLVVGQPGVEVRNDGAIALDLKRGDFRVSRAVLVGPSSRLSVQGTGSVRHGLALSVDGSVNAGVLATLSPRFTEATGLVTVRANISGPFANPRVFGRAAVEGGAFRFAGFPEPVEQLNGTLTFSSRRVLFEEFAARIAGGELTLGGSATLRGLGLERYDLDIRARDLTLRPSSGLVATFGGNAQLAWNPNQRLPALRGTVHLRRVSYREDIVLAQTLGDLSRRRRADVEGYDPTEDVLEVDLRIVDDAPVRIANNLVDAEIQIEDAERPFRVVGTDQRLGAVGTLVIPRGVVHFRGADFNIRRGTIAFDDTFAIDPSFDVLATTEVRRTGTTVSGPAWRVTLHAHGTSDSFQLDTSSDPELSQEDIVLLLAIGMTRIEMEQLQTGDNLSTVALEALTAVTGIDQEVQDAVQVIDSFSIASRYSPRTGRTEPQITVGKRITDRVRLTGSTGLSDSQQVRAGVELQVDEETSLQVVYDNQNTQTASGVGNVGADVRWRLEFE